jgi:hypothetical protein
MAIIPQYWKWVRFSVHAVMILSSEAFKEKAL